MNQPDTPALRRQDLAEAEPLLVRTLLAEWVRRGRDPALLLRGLGVRADELEATDLQVSYAQASQVVRRAIELLKDPQLALELGLQTNLVSWGYCFLALLASADSREMLALAAVFVPGCSRFLDLYVTEDALGFAVVADGIQEDPEVHAFLVDNTFGALLRACRQIVHADFGPVSVDLSASPTASSAFYLKTFGCTVRFNQPFNRMNFASQSALVGTADVVVAKRLRAYLTQEAARPATNSVLEATVLRAIRAKLREAPTLRDIATSMHMTERTVRRRLAEAGRAYATMLDDERKRRALPLIREGRLALSTVAQEVGFSDARSLRRATQRWTAATPTEIQKKLR